jgi:hypothetical protein
VEGPWRDLPATWIDQSPATHHRSSPSPRTRATSAPLYVKPFSEYPQTERRSRVLSSPLRS